MNKTSRRHLLALVACAVLGSGCEQLGIPDPAKASAQAEADGKAVGSACRHAGRAIEDCFTLNPSASKSAVFTGWKEMNDYMAENKIAEVVPQLPPPPPPGTTAPKKKKAAEHDGGDGDKGKAGEEDAKATQDAPANTETADGDEPRKRRRTRE